MQSVLQSAVSVKPIIIADVTAFVWGIEDGRAGKSEFDGYDFFCGWKYCEWRKGWALGKRAAARQAMQTAQVLPDDFAGALADVAEHGIRYCPAGIDWAAVEDEKWGE